MYTVLGWSDLHFLRFLKSYRFLLISYIFRRSNPKSCQISPRGAATFSFSKNRRDLTYEYFWVKIFRILPYTYIKEQSPKENSKLKVVEYFLKIPKKGQKTVFDLKNILKKCSPFLLIFAFKQAKAHILFQVQPFKMLN